jgi:hypothetical protein
VNHRACAAGRTSARVAGLRRHIPAHRATRGPPSPFRGCRVHASSSAFMRAGKGAASPKGRGLRALMTPDLIRGNSGAKGEGMRLRRRGRSPSPFRPKRLGRCARCDAYELRYIGVRHSECRSRVDPTSVAGSSLTLGEVVAPLPAPEKRAGCVNATAVPVRDRLELREHAAADVHDPQRSSARPKSRPLPYRDQPSGRSRPIPHRNGYCVHTSPSRRGRAPSPGGRGLSALASQHAEGGRDAYAGRVRDYGAW